MIAPQDLGFTCSLRTCLAGRFRMAEKCHHRVSLASTRKHNSSDHTPQAQCLAGTRDPSEQSTNAMEQGQQERENLEACAYSHYTHFS